MDFLTYNACHLTGKNTRKTIRKALKKFIITRIIQEKFFPPYHVNVKFNANVIRKEFFGQLPDILRCNDFHDSPDIQFNDI